MAGHCIIAVFCIIISIYTADAVHNWDQWNSWSTCNATCDGVQTRYRKCMKHAPNETISQGTAVLTRHCEEERYLVLNSHESTFQGKKEIQVKQCSPECSVSRAKRVTTYHWDKWTSWTSCNATCDGTQYRLRACIRHQTILNRTHESSTDISHCLSHNTGHYDYNRRGCGTVCPVWSDWSDWSDCSATCDDGTRFRGRHCVNGNTCEGSVFDQNKCNLGRCLHPVDGGWGSWDEWGPCSTSCSLGYNVRYRSCNNPVPQDGGNDCDGKRDQVRVCPLVNCPIDGGWGNFTANPCTVTCGVGVLVSVRKCDNPPPQYGGSNCVGSATKFDRCVKPLCDIDGDWSKWSNFTSCSVVCGTGHIRRTRTCTHPSPQANGKDCEGEPLDIQECDNGLCPSDIRICDKSLVQRFSSQTLANTTTNATTSSSDCDSKTAGFTDGYALIETYCKAPVEKAKWRLGIKIYNNCEMIPLYTPVGSTDNGVHVKDVGVMADCFDGTLKMMTQSCNTDIVMKSFNLTDAFTSVHMILFDE